MESVFDSCNRHLQDRELDFKPVFKGQMLLFYSPKHILTRRAFLGYCGKLQIFEFEGLPLLNMSNWLYCKILT